MILKRPRGSGRDGFQGRMTRLKGNLKEKLKTAPRQSNYKYMYTHFNLVE